MSGPSFQIRPLVRAVRQLPHPLRGLLTLYALWNVVAGVPVFLDLGIGVNLLMVVSGCLAVLVGLTVVLDVNGAAVSLAVQFGASTRQPSADRATGHRHDFEPASGASSRWLSAPRS